MATLTTKTSTKSEQKNSRNTTHKHAVSRVLFHCYWENSTKPDVNDAPHVTLGFMNECRLSWNFKNFHVIKDQTVACFSFMSQWCPRIYFTPLQFFLQILTECERNNFLSCIFWEPKSKFWKFFSNVLPRNHFLPKFELSVCFTTKRLTNWCMFLCPKQNNFGEYSYTLLGLSDQWDEVIVWIIQKTCIAHWLHQNQNQRCDTVQTGRIELLFFSEKSMKDLILSLNSALEFSSSNRRQKETMLSLYHWTIPIDCASHNLTYKWSCG